MAITNLKAALLNTGKLQVGEKEYTLVLDMNAIAKANHELGKDLTVITSWKDLNALDLSVICWAALDQFHPEVTLREVRQWLGPVQQNDLFMLLIEACWPGITERIAAVENQKPGEPEPNLQPASK